MDDMAAKGRRAVGPNSMSAKLTATDVLSIRSQFANKTATQLQLAEMFGVNKGTVWEIIHRRSWKHI